ncbi:MAG TPA: hypothetical protein VMD91_08275 [Candidatus Sulfotelmatobacter sp.]|nr:hypothetical protein [Candidatus Sulfotelmatobacter sp.]
MAFVAFAGVVRPEPGRAQAPSPSPSAASTVPPVLPTPYPYDGDPLVQDAGAAVDDFPGTYRGSAYCHPLPAPSGASLAISTMTLSLLKDTSNVGPSWNPDMNAIGVKGVVTLSPTDDNRSLLEPNESFVLADRSIAAHEYHTSYFLFRQSYMSGRINQLIDTSGDLQLYADNLVPDPGFSSWVGTAIATFYQAPLHYEANVGVATLTGRIYVQHVSPLSPRASMCYVRLMRTARYTTSIGN